MKKTYKNAKEKLKAELAEKQAELVRKQMTLDAISKQLEECKKKKADETAKRYSTILYCSVCKHVQGVSVPYGVREDEGNCTHCGVISNKLNPTLYRVVYYPGLIRI